MSLCCCYSYPHAKDFIRVIDNVKFVFVDHQFGQGSFFFVWKILTWKKNNYTINLSRASGNFLQKELMFGGMR